MNIYVGNFPRHSTEYELLVLVVAFGDGTKVNIIKDKFTGDSRGFGFVEMINDDDAENAINELNGKDFQGRDLTVSKAKPRTDRPRNGGGFNRGGSRGGFGGNRNGGRGGFGGGRSRY